MARTKRSGPGGEGKGGGKAGRRSKVVQKASARSSSSEDECTSTMKNATNSSGARRTAYIYFDETAPKSSATYTPVDQPTDRLWTPTLGDRARLHAEIDGRNY